MVSLRRTPFRDFSTEDFPGPGMFNCLPPGGCKSTFQGSRLTLGLMADAVVYRGGDADDDTKRQLRILEDSWEVRLAKPNEDELRKHFNLRRRLTGQRDGLHAPTDPVVVVGNGNGSGLSSY